MTTVFTNFAMVMIVNKCRCFAQRSFLIRLIISVFTADNTKRRYSQKCNPISSSHDVSTFLFRPPLTVRTRRNVFQLNITIRIRESDPAIILESQR